MFIGHFAPALVAAAVTPERPRLGLYFIAAQLVDWAFFAFVLVGIEDLRIVPGITAASALAASFIVSLTHRDHAQSCVFITAHGAGGVLDHDWTRYARKGQTVVVYMGLNALGEVTKRALTQGVEPEMPVAVIDNGTRLDQRVILGRLDDIEAKVAEAELPGPALIVIGHVVTLYGALGVKGSRPEHQMELKAGHAL